jgi:hypothetical protein
MLKNKSRHKHLTQEYEKIANHSNSQVENVLKLTTPPPGLKQISF